MNIGVKGFCGHSYVNIDAGIPVQLIKGRLAALCRSDGAGHSTFYIVWRLLSAQDGAGQNDNDETKVHDYCHNFSICRRLFRRYIDPKDGIARYGKGKIEGTVIRWATCDGKKADYNLRPA